MKKSLFIIYNFEQSVTEDTFKTYYGDNIGSHLWARFLSWRRNAVQFYQTLDIENSEIFIKMLEKQ